MSKALALNLRPLVVSNKIDRPSARPQNVENEILDLFAALDATDEQLDFTTVYASAKEGWAIETLDGDLTQGMKPLLDKIFKLFPSTSVELIDPFAFVVTMLSRDTYMGRLATGRVFSGIGRVGDVVHLVTRDGQRRSNARISKIMASRGLKSQAIDMAFAGDIVSLPGIEYIGVGDTIAVPPEGITQTEMTDLSKPTIQPLWTPAIDPPTVSVTFTVSDSPLQGKEGNILNSQKLADCRYAEAENNVSISVSPDEHSDLLEVKYRVELQLDILIETMRRQGAELALSPPRVLFKIGENGKRLEPIEEVHVEVDEEQSAVVIEKNV